MKKETEQKRMEEVTPAPPAAIVGKVEHDDHDKDALEMCDNDGNTPLMAAIGSGSIDCVRSIVNAVKCGWEEHLQSSNLSPQLDPQISPKEFKLEDGDLELHVPLGRQLFSFQNTDGLSPLQCSALLSNPTILLYLLQSVSIKFGRLLLLTETRDGNNIMHCA